MPSAFFWERRRKGNVVEALNVPPPDRTIAEMRVGEKAYVTPWAYDIDSNTLDTSYLIHTRWGGTVSMSVECVGVGLYKVDFSPD